MKRLIIFSLTALSFLSTSCESSISYNQNSAALEIDTIIDFSDNPILSNINLPTMPNLGVASNFILFKNGKYKLWYSSLKDDRYDVEYAESYDAITWKNITAEPVIKPTYDSWDSYAVYSGPVIEENGIYKMYYVGVSNYQYDTYIGLALSFDGINWMKHPSPIIIEPGKRIAANSIFKINDEYILYYSYTYQGTLRGISVSKSKDGVTWQKIKDDILPVTQSWESPGTHSPSIIYENNIYYMVYGTISHNAFGFAYSKDGLNWTKSERNPCYIPSQTYNNWTQQLRYPHILKINNNFRLYYTGKKNGTYHLGFAELFLKN